jgi:thiazole/oxazole-forming peptide maturase SagD family component
MSTTKRRYVSLSHLLPSTGNNVVRLFVIAAGREMSLECHNDISRVVYETILKGLQGTPKTKAEVIKKLGHLNAADKAFAGQAFDALLRKGMIAETTRLASALSRTWQNPQVYKPEGYSSQAEASRDMQPYTVTAGLKSYPFLPSARYARRSTRNFDASATLDITDIQSILADSYRTTPDGLRPTPSPGAIYPVRLHLINHGARVTVTKPRPHPPKGVYQYDPYHLSLEHQSGVGFFGTRTIEYLTNDPDAARPVAYIAISVDVEAFAQKYGNVSFVFQGVVVGSVMQRLTDMIEGKGIGTLTLFGIRHLEADRILQHPDRIKTVLFMAIGKAADKKTVAPQLLKSKHKEQLKRLRIGSKKLIPSSGVINLDNLNHTKVPTDFVGAWVKYAQPTFKGRSDTYSFGSATTEDAALIKALAEALERLASGNVRVDAPMVPASQLTIPWLDPRRLLPLDAEQMTIGKIEPFEPDMPINWTKGTYAGGGEVYAPSAMIYYPYVLKGAEKRVAAASSNGVAAHFERAAAIEGALMELIERDAIMRTWITKEPPMRIDPSSLPPAAADRVKELLSYGRQIDVLDMTPKNKVPTFLVIVRGDNFPYFFAGAASRLSAEAALHKAMDEAVMGFVSRVELERRMTAEHITKEEKGVFDTDSHGMFYALNADAREQVAWLFKGEIRPFSTETDAPSMASLLKRYNPAVFTLDNPAHNNPLKIVRLLCDKFIPIEFGKIGVPYLHHSLPKDSSKPELPHFFN